MSIKFLTLACPCNLRTVASYNNYYYQGAHQYHSVYHHSSWNMQRPLHRFIRCQHQNQRPGAIACHCQVQICVASIVNAKTMVPIALIVCNYVHLIFTVFPDHTAVRVLSMPTECRPGNSITASAADLTAFECDSITCMDVLEL